MQEEQKKNEDKQEDTGDLEWEGEEAGTERIYYLNKETEERIRGQCEMAGPWSWYG